jgi:anti-sigma regulatory factor (Ser/Thr protein kinase)
MTSPPPGRRVRVTGAGGDLDARIVCDERFDAATLSMLRQRVAACAAEAGVPDDRAVDITLAVHELAANAVRHGAGSGRLVMYTSAGSLSCQVSDAGPGSHPWPLQQGHGLWIVHAAADKVTTSSGADGSQVTAVFGWPAKPGRDRPSAQAT